RVGRQELVFGEQRLVGHVSWLNAARTFDAARLTLRAPRVQVEMFASSVVRIDTDGWDRGGHGGSFHGVHATSASLVPRGTIEP
ncbi:MAG: alginate export family protein, partial [Acidobacteria bacterium]|nr:alginate export family protein [Acidobacteriota bacterium]